MHEMDGVAEFTPMQFLAISMKNPNETRPDVVRALVRAAPECVCVHGTKYKRPIDLLLGAIGVCELRVNHENDPDTANQHRLHLVALYKCAGYIVAAHADRVEEYEQKPLLVHVCVQAQHIPRNLVEIVIRRFGRVQSRQANARGDLPLHIAAAHWRPDAEDYEDFLPRILNVYPEGARVLNQQDKLHLELAVDAGRSWNTGIRLLLNANPLALRKRSIPYSLFPIILGELLQTDDASIAFLLLRCNPDMIPTGREHGEPTDAAAEDNYL
jgi:hypothetical protein